MPRSSCPGIAGRGCGRPVVGGRDGIRARERRRAQVGAGSSALPAGAQITVLSGDPFKDGLYALRLKMPAGYEIPAHSHPTSEYVKVDQRQPAHWHG